MTWKQFSSSLCHTYTHQCYQKGGCKHTRSKLTLQARSVTNHPHLFPGGTEILSTRCVLMNNSDPSIPPFPALLFHLLSFSLITTLLLWLFSSSLASSVLLLLRFHTQGQTALHLQTALAPHFASDICKQVPSCRTLTALHVWSIMVFSQWAHRDCTALFSLPEYATLHGSIVLYMTESPKKKKN